MMHLRELEEVADFQLTPKQNARVDALLAESDSLRCFAIERIYKCPNCDPLPTEEIVNAYWDYCRERDWTPLPGKSIEKALPDIMMDLFRSSKGTHAAGQKGAHSRLHRRQTSPPGRRTVTTAERISRYIGKIPGAVSGNGGHAQTFKVAMVLFNGFGCSEAETLEWLRHYNSKCEPPWSEAELRHKARSATEAAYDKPRGWMLTSKRFSPVRLQVPVFPGKSCPVARHGCHGSFPLPTQLRGDSYTHKRDTPELARESESTVANVAANGTASQNRDAADETVPSEPVEPNPTQEQRRSQGGPPYRRRTSQAAPRWCDQGTGGCVIFRPSDSRFLRDLHRSEANRRAGPSWPLCANCYAARPRPFRALLGRAPELFAEGSRRRNRR